MEDDETVDSGGYGQPCGACEYRRTDCGPDCIFVPFFPAGSRADFARVRALIGEDTLTNVINNNLGPELRSAIVKFMIIEARARADGSSRGRNLSIANAASLLSGILRLLLDCLVILTLIDRHLLGGYLFRSVETATSLQDVQDVGIFYLGPHM